jgi:hypothetical protein
MSYLIDNFASDIALRVKKWASYANATAELNTIANTLSTDQIAHDQTIVTPMAPLAVGAQTPFTNDINLIVNRGKAGNLSGSAMANAIASSAGPPVNTIAPVVSGTGAVGSTLSCTTGTWQHFPTYAYQWLRAGANIAGATAATYVLAAADSTNGISCRVTATNAAGSATASSNSIAVT